MYRLITAGYVLALGLSMPIGAAEQKAAVIMIGTNNIGGYTAPQIAGGIKAIVEELKKQKPGIKILVLGVFPRAAPAMRSGAWNRSPKASSPLTRS